MCKRRQQETHTIAQSGCLLILESIVRVHLLLLAHHVRPALEEQVQKIAGLLVVLVRKLRGSLEGLVEELLCK
jgi:hypothetical protein